MLYYNKQLKLYLLSDCFTCAAFGGVMLVQWTYHACACVLLLRNFTLITQYFSPLVCFSPVCRLLAQW